MIITILELMLYIVIEFKWQILLIALLCFALIFGLMILIDLASMNLIGEENENII